MMARILASGGRACLLGLLLGAGRGQAAGAGGAAATNYISKVRAASPLTEVLSPGKWPVVEDSVDRALAWMATQQAADGSFPTLPAAQPAVTSLCVLAFLARGHQPGLGPYGTQMERAIDFVLACQKEDGLFSFQPFTNNVHVDMAATHTAVYNHAISGLMLGEVFGHVTGRRMEEVKQGIGKALQFTRELQTHPKAHAADRGGWRYLHLRWDHFAADSDLSVTAWQILFLRSARNAEFNVPQGYVDEAMEFVHRCWNEKKGVFNYALEGATDVRSSRGMMGAGILCLSLAGEHQTPAALAAGNWLLAHPYRRFGELIGTDDNFFYSTYYCSQAAAQLGGTYWKGIYGPLADVLLTAQRADGSWPPEPQAGISRFGNVYTTAMAVLSLTPPYQLLPVYQR
jgi:prenyltransferase/squalene oxidase-like repeat protein